MKRILVFLSVCAIAMFASCAREVALSGEPGSPDKGKHARLNFRINASNASLPGTRAADLDFENNINDIMVAVLVPGPSDGFVTDSIIIVDNFKPTGPTTSAFSIGLRPDIPTPAKLLIITNLGAKLDDEINELGSIISTAIKGQSEEYFHTTFVGSIYELLGEKDPNPDLDHLPVTASMPMYGETIIETIAAGENKDVEVSLMRSTARADVAVNLMLGSGAFVPVEAYIYHANYWMPYIPLESSLDPEDPSRVILPSVWPIEQKAPALQRPLYPEGRDPDTGVFFTTYLPESESMTPPDVDATCLVIGGYFGEGNTTEITYYRIDFNSKKSGHPYGQILRNYKYFFNVTKVTAPGFATPDLAAENVSEAIVVSVTPWQDDVTDIQFTDPAGSFSRNATSVNLGAESGDTQTFTVRSSVPFTVDFPDPDLPPGGMSISPASPPAGTTVLADEWFNVSFEVTSTGPDATPPWTEWTFTVTSLKNNGVGDYTEQLIFGVGTGEVVTNITQAGGSAKGIKVLSVGTGPGSFAAETTSQLKTMLASAPEFSAGGAIDGFAGITFYHDPSIDDMFSTGDYISLMNDVLPNYDILLVSYEADINTACNTAVSQWLINDNGVMFIGTDNIDGVSYNAGFLRTLATVYTAYDITWNGLDGLIEDIVDILPDLGGFLDDILNGIQDVNGTFPATVPTGAAPFLNGKFGAVNLNANFECSDNEAGYFDIDDPSIPVMSQVLPLVQTYRSDGTISWSGIPLLSVPSLTHSRQSEVLMGVDVAKRIVYIGESNLLTDMPYTAGEAINSSSDPLTLLMANTWAWAIETVLGR